LTESFGRQEAFEIGDPPDFVDDFVPFDGPSRIVGGSIFSRSRRHFDQSNVMGARALDLFLDSVKPVSELRVGSAQIFDKTIDP
jgi:hypothetical protein